MGPYCDFCGNRCFTPFPQNTPGHMIRAYKNVSIIATCREGQKFEKEKYGFCYADMIAFIKEYGTSLGERR